jgi:hypothetical protein
MVVSHIYVFSGRRNQYANTNAVFIPTVTIPHWRFMIFNIDMNCPIIQRQRYYETHRAMQLSVSIDCPFLIATFSSIYTKLLHD